MARQARGAWRRSPVRLPARPASPPARPSARPPSARAASARLPDRAPRDHARELSCPCGLREISAVNPQGEGAFYNISIRFLDFQYRGVGPHP